MTDLTDEQLESLHNDLRGRLVEKQGRLTKTPNHLQGTLIKEMQEINNKMNEAKAEQERRANN